MIERKIISRNFTGGRSGQSPQFVVIHTYNGAGRSLYNWFNNPQAQASAHYAVFKDGNGEQYVDEGNTAWHAGNWDANIKSIGIEHQDDGNPNDAVRTNELYETSAQLIADIYRRYGWDKKNKALIKPHKEFTGTGCPAALNIDRIRNRVYDILNPAAPPIDNYYRILDTNGKQLNAYTSKDNAFNFWYDDKSRKVTYQNKDITNQFLTMANKLEEDIKNLQIVVTEKDTKLSELQTKLAGALEREKTLSSDVESKNIIINDQKDIISGQNQEIEQLRVDLKEAKKDFITKIFEFIGKILNRK